MANIFYYKDIIKINDSLDGFEELLVKSCSKKSNIFFDFKLVRESLSKVKNIILKNIENINFNNLYFYNGNDFINFILKKPVYLPYNINLFINEGCIIGCNYCDNINDSFNKLNFKDIKKFLSKYNLGDNINYNIIGQGDPLFHPQLFKILEYIKSIGGHITFFSGGKSLLYCKDVNKLNLLVDEFKINLSASNFNVYNLTHKNKISESNFIELLDIFRLIAKKSTFITVLNLYNISDLLELYKLIISINAFGFEIKRDLFYRKDDILNNKKIFEKVVKLINIFFKNKKINLTTNIIPGTIVYNIFSEFLYKQSSLLDIYVNKKIKLINIEDINNLNTCHQFGNSIDIIEKGVISVCCKYDIGNVSNIDYDGLYYNNELFKEKYITYSKSTPVTCKSCPMPIDRYKNYLKYTFINEI